MHNRVFPGRSAVGRARSSLRALSLEVSLTLTDLSTLHWGETPGPCQRCTKPAKPDSSLRVGAFARLRRFETHKRRRRLCHWERSTRRAGALRLVCLTRALNMYILPSFLYLCSSFFDTTTKAHLLWATRDMLCAHTKWCSCPGWAVTWYLFVVSRCESVPHREEK